MERETWNLERGEFDDSNAGIQFGSKKVDEFGQARGLGTAFP